ncbi:MAG: ABC transporter permease [Bacteroidota bacterium]|nr:ABC transporter permease [Bacteroidota bacterium]MDP4232606.1 ABC transporter permease [Bacteroidota bacterium]MDP4242940.1 ABC transporter permease [Bacteroidota bacterium]MDP4286485.1 ABC transporter permease [Bacteroidota bacterium]
MFQYIVRRVLLFIPTLFFVTVISFGIIQMAPGDPAELKAGVGSEGAQRGNQQLNEQIIKQIRAQWHLDKPIWYWSIFSDAKDSTGELKPLRDRIHFAWNGTNNQYHLWMGDLLHLNFGKSFQDQRPVIDKIMERLPITATLALISEFLAFIIAIPIGIYSAAKQREGGKVDKSISTILFILYSLPGFWVATMLIIFFGGGDFLAWFPNNGIHGMDYPYPTWWANTGDLLWHIALPIVCYTYASLASLSRFMRASMLDVIRQDYIRTARAKGLSEKIVVYKHALRNSLIPIITIIAGTLPALIGGSFIIETIFSIPGLGLLGVSAVFARDYPIVLADFVISSVLVLAGILLADILYSVVDPRIAFSKRTG